MQYTVPMRPCCTPPLLAPLSPPAVAPLSQSLGPTPLCAQVGVMIGAPVFAALSKCHNALRLIGVGGALFSAAALVCGFSQSFAMVLVFR